MLYLPSTCVLFLDLGFFIKKKRILIYSLFLFIFERNNNMEDFRTRLENEELALKIADFVKGIGDFTIEQTKTGAILITPSEKDIRALKDEKDNWSIEFKYDELKKSLEKFK